MFWFKGNINEAINKSKNEKKVFVVFINGDDEVSRKMDSLYEKLSSKLLELPIVAIKLESQSDNCKLFSQIYPVILIPSTYFIDFNGVAIEIIGGSVEDENVLLDKMNKTIEVYKNSLPSNGSENVNQLTANDSSDNSTNNEPQLVTTASTSGIQSVPINESTSVTETKNIDEKVQRANQLIEALRQKKAKEEADNEKAEETERRKGMKEMQKSKRLREDKETNDIIQEREREKREERLAREKVLAQIAADREDRKKRNMQFTEQQTPEKTVADNSDDTIVRQRVAHDRARIQFRLPDGSTANNIFEAKDTLQTVRQYVSSHFNINSFVLSTTFPRKEFSAEEYCKTMEELNLCPSSVLLVISRSGNVISGAITSPTIFWQIVTYLSLPFVMIWNMMTSFFSRSNDLNTSNDETNERLPPKRDPKTFYNKDGNIARMRDRMADDDEDNNTWNGNSTQQM